MIELLLLFVLALLPSFISFILSKARHKTLKYLAPLASLLIVCFFYFGYANFKCDPDAVESFCGLQGAGNYLFILICGVGFIISLLWCILFDISRARTKRKERV